MTGENALKACARELLAAELGWKSEAACLEWIDAVEREVLNRAGSAIPMSAALRAIEKALTRSPVCEDAGEVVEALKPFAKVAWLFKREDEMTVVARIHAEPETKAELSTTDFQRAAEALAKSLPSLKGGGR